MASNVLQTVTRKRCVLRHRRAGDGEAHHSRVSEIVKCEVADAGTIGERAPRRPEPVLSFVMR